MDRAQAARKEMTVAEFLAWDSGDDRSYELVSGFPVAMAPPSRAHRLIASVLFRKVAQALDGRPTYVVEAEAGITSSRSEGNWFQADLAVTCQPHRRGQQEIPEPLLIIEILSPSTEDHDRKVKLVAYRELPSVREVLLVDQARLYAEVHRRLDESRWLTELVHGPDAIIRLETLALDLPLRDLYAGLDLG